MGSPRKLFRVTLGAANTASVCTTPSKLLINKMTAEGLTVLILAVAEGQLKVVDLLKSGANSKVEGRDGLRLLDRAFGNGNKRWRREY